ncbi:hypothetical protein BSKO_04799 [Bryopsis sp. KO-2023]|nr:hypothetical protein BSKO_04799 [Bryopsis sp. KO-2023]
MSDAVRLFVTVTVAVSFFRIQLGEGFQPLLSLFKQKRRKKTCHNFPFVQACVQRLKTAGLSCTQAELQVAQQALHSVDDAADVGGGINSKFDAAVFELSQNLSASKRKFYGRLNNIARVSYPSAAAALNAVLRETTSLSTCLVVGERAAAVEVLKYFEENKIGVATCKIVEELPRATAHAPGKGKHAGCVPLMDFLHIDSTVEETRPVFAGMLGSWFLTDTKEKALKIIENAGGKGRKNIVTRAGELFKADGEVVGSGSRTNANYSLSTEVQKITKVLRASSSAKKKDARVAKELEKKAKECGKIVEDISKQARPGVGEAEDVLLKRRHELDALISKEKKLSILFEKTSVQRVDADPQNSKQKLKEAETELENLQKNSSQTDALDQLKTKAAGAQAAYDALRCKTEGGQDLIKAESKLRDIRDQSKQLQDAKTRLESDAKNVMRQLRNGENDMEAQRNADSELQALLHKNERAAIERNRFDEEIAQAKSLHADATKQLRSLKKAITKKSKARDSWNEKLEDTESSIESVQKELADIRQQARRITACLEELPPQVSETATGDAIGALQGVSSQRGRRRYPRDVHRRQATSIDELRLSTGSNFEQRCEEEACALSREETRLELAKKTIDPKALDQDLAAVEALQGIEKNLKQQSDRLSQLYCAKENLEEERYERFLSAMQFVNVK